MFDVLANLAPHPHLAIVRKRGHIEAILPFQGRKRGLARPLGAPLSDQHSLIVAPDSDITLIDVVSRLGMSGFVFTGLLQPVSGALRQVKAIAHVADLSDGIEAYMDWRNANWRDQVKKNDRRKRQGERQWGTMRIEIACPKTSNHFENFMRLKQDKFVETNRHNVLGVAWINAFLRALYQSPDPNFVGEITVLYFGDHLAGLEFGLRGGKAMHSWFPAFDRAYAQVSPGILLMNAMIEMCGTRGITKVDLGIGHDQYKRHASNAPVPVWSGTLPISPLRRAGALTYVTGLNWLQKTPASNIGSFVGKLERRNEMILSAEPSLSGRFKGYVAAMGALGN